MVLPRMSVITDEERASGIHEDDLDRHVAELILKEAKKKAEKYSQHGIRAYLRNNM